MKTGTPPTDIKSYFDGLLTGCAKSQTQLIATFHSRKKLANETYGQYNSALLDILKAAHPDMTLINLKTFIRPHFVSCISDKVRDIVEFNIDKTWDQIINTLDRITPSTDSGQPGSVNPLRLLDSFENEPAEINYMSGKVNPANFPIARSNNFGQASYGQSNRSNYGQSIVSTRGKFNGNYHYCHNFGHRKDECRKLQSSLNTSNNFNRNDNYQPNSSQHYPYSNRVSNTGISSNQLLDYNRLDGVNDVNRYNKPFRQDNGYNLHSSRATNMNISAVGNPISNSTFNSSLIDDSSGSELYAQDQTYAVQDSSSNYIMVNSNTMSFGNQDEFPFYGDDYEHADFNMMEAENVDIVERLPLLQVPVGNAVNNQVKCHFTLGTWQFTCPMVKAHVDSLSALSFINEDLIMRDIWLQTVKHENRVSFYNSENNKMETDYEFWAHIKIQGVDEFSCFITRQFTGPTHMILGRNILGKRDVLYVHYDEGALVQDSTVESTIDINAMESQEATLNMSKQSTLLRTNAVFCIKYDLNFKGSAVALLDSGSTHSFLSPSRLSNDV